MIFADKIESKIFSLDELLQRIEFWRKLGDKIVFTNGCFDILHEGHIHLLASCSEFGERLIVGLNADSSINALKGPSRPINNQDSRVISNEFKRKLTSIYKEEVADGINNLGVEEQSIQQLNP